MTLTSFVAEATPLSLVASFTTRSRPPPGEEGSGPICSRSKAIYAASGSPIA